MLSFRIFLSLSVLVFLHIYFFYTTCFLKCVLMFDAKIYLASKVWCVQECLVKVCFRVKDLAHWLHMNGFSPVCFLICLRKSPEVVQANLHWLHLYGLFRVCLFIMWSFNSPLLMHEYSHTVHLSGFSPEWVLLCLLRLLECIVSYSHWLHLCRFSPVCFMICSLSWEALLQE